MRVVELPYAWTGQTLPRLLVVPARGETLSEGQAMESNMDY